jgi:hypothetical protein
MVKANQFVSLQGGHGVGAPFIVTEFDLGHAGGEQFNDGSDLAANESLLRYVLENGDF